MTLDAAKPKHRYVALDSLRGVCACMIVAVHFTSQSHFQNLSFVRDGFLFVDFFFVLSGFVIGSSYGRKLQEGFSIGQFMWLRLWRVYPLHFFMLLMFLAFECLFLLVPSLGGMTARSPFTGNYTIEGLIPSLLMVQIFVGPDGVWNIPAWSIAAEVWTYLIFALLLRFSGRWLVPCCGLLIIAAILIIPYLGGSYLFTNQYGSLPRCLYGFALGICGWWIMPIVKKWTLGGRFAQSAAEILLVAVIMAFVAMAGKGPLTMLAPLVFFVAVLLFAREGGIVSRLLRTPPFVLAGTLSYSIYLIHWFLLWRFLNALSLLGKLSHGRISLVIANSASHNAVGGGPWVSDLLFVVFLLGVIACAYVTYRLIELPGQAFARRRVPRQAPAPLAVEPGAP